jgi:hypothetical protein
VDEDAPYPGKFPLTWLRARQQRDADELWEAWYNGICVGCAIVYEHAAYGYMADIRLGAQRNLDWSKKRVQLEFDRWHEKPYVGELNAIFIDMLPN